MTRTTWMLAALLVGCADGDGTKDDTDVAETDGTVDSDTDLGTDTDPVDTGDTFTEDSDTDVPVFDGCVPQEVADVLAAHLETLVANVGFLQGHAGEREAVSFLVVPGWAVVGPTYATLIAACTEAGAYDPYCDGRACSRVVCNATPPSWTVEQTLDSPPARHRGFVYEEAANTFTWPGDGDVLDVELATEATQGALDWSMTGTLAYAFGAFTLEETYPSLHPDGEVVLSVTYAYADQSFEGALYLGEDRVLEFVDGATFEPGEGVCP